MLTINPNLPAILAVCLLGTSAMAKTEIPITCNLPRYGWQQFPDLEERKSVRALDLRAFVLNSKLSLGEFPAGIILPNPLPRAEPKPYYIQRSWSQNRVLEGSHSYGVRPLFPWVATEVSGHRNSDFYPAFRVTRLLLEQSFHIPMVGNAIEEKDIDILRREKLSSSLQNLLKEEQQNPDAVAIEIQILQLAPQAAEGLTTKLRKAGFSNCKNTAWNKITGTLPVKSLDEIVQLTSVQSIRPLRNN